VGKTVNEAPDGPAAVRDHWRQN